MSEPGVLSYAIAGIAFALLAVLATISDRGIREGRALIAVVWVSTVWAGVFAAVSQRAVPFELVAGVEALRYLGWLWLLYLLVAPAWPRAIGWSVAALLAAWFIVGGLLVDPGRVLTIGGLIAALLGLVMLEQAVRNARPDVRHDMRLLLLGIGGLFAYDLFLFSQAELFGGIDRTSWQLRGVVNALLVPLLAVGARRLPQIRFGFSVSRQVTFYTTAFIAVGIYVLAVAATGLLLERMGGQWGELLRLALMGGAIVVLVLLVGSMTIRRHLRVFLSKHFHRSKYDYRLEWLTFIRTLSSASVSDVPAAAVQSVAKIISSPGGVLYRQPDSAGNFVPSGCWPGSIEGISETETFADDSPLVAFMRARRWIIDLREYRQQPDLYDHAQLPDWLDADRRWRLVSPIFLGDALLGFFLLLEPPAPFRLTYEDRDLLNTAGQHVATLLAQQDADLRVAELSQFEAYNRLTTFVMHDLKNCAAQLSLLVANAARHRHKPEFVDDAFATIERTAERMTRLIGQLRGDGSAAAANHGVDLQEALRGALARCDSLRPRPILDACPPHKLVVVANLERMTSALEHVIRNAQEAAGELGEVRVVLEDRVSHARVSVKDTGAGMDTAFIRNRLFRPFDTTKGPTGMGIGAYQTREFARSVGGTVEVKSEPGRGTVFCMELPLVTA